MRLSGGTVSTMIPHDTTPIIFRSSESELTLSNGGGCSPRMNKKSKNAIK